MKSVIVAADSPSGARLGISVAADLYWGCGACVSLAYALADPAPRDCPGLDAIGRLSDTLFLTHGRSGCVATFPVADTISVPEALGDVLEESPIPIEDYWTASAGDRIEQICGHVERSGASLALVAGGEALREGLLRGASVPVWLLNESDRTRHWFPLRRVLCAARAERAVALSKGIAEQMGAQIEFGALASLLKRESAADLAVVGRGLPFHLLKLVSGTGRRPVIVV